VNPILKYVSIFNLSNPAMIIDNKFKIDVYAMFYDFPFKYE
jgi:hypothetical protein